MPPRLQPSGPWSRIWPLLVQTPYVLLLSFPGINVVSAAEFAGEMGPIANSPDDGAITGRAGLYPSRYQSDRWIAPGRSSAEPIVHCGTCSC